MLQDGNAGVPHNEGGFSGALHTKNVNVFANIGVSPVYGNNQANYHMCLQGLGLEGQKDLGLGS